MDLSPESLRAHFHKLSADRAKIDAKLDPLRAELNTLVSGDIDLSVKAARAREEKVREQIRALQDELSPIEMDRAACARALSGKTGMPD